MTTITSLKLLHVVETFWSLLCYPIVARAQQKERQAIQKREHELALARIAADANKEVLLAFTDSMKISIAETTSMAKEQTAVLQEWLKGFRTTESPSSSTVRESDEAHAERERLRASGFPVEFNVQEQMEWLMGEMNKEP